MKKLLFIFLVPSISFAGFSKPSLVARLSDSNAWNAPDNMWCFGGEPVLHKNEIFLNCFDVESNLMGRWNSEGFEVISRAEPENMFAKPVVSFNKVNWYEFNEFSVQRSYIFDQKVVPVEITNLGPMSDYNDSFLPYSADAFFFKTKGEQPQLWIWKKDEVTPFFNPHAAYIFTPHVGPLGEIALKTRDLNLNENAPDRIWAFDGSSWKVVMEDIDANASSRWKSFRHQMVIEGNKIVLVANDGLRDSLVMIEDGKVSVIATAGVDLKSFDFFAPKMRAGTILMRGVDFEGRKVTYVHDGEGFRKLLSQGDIVQTDIGAARVHYQSQDAIFYGAGGVDERGNVVLQATLTDADHPRTLLGIGLIKFNRE